MVELWKYTAGQYLQQQHLRYDLDSFQPERNPWISTQVDQQKMEDINVPDKVDMSFVFGNDKNIEDILTGGKRSLKEVFF